MTEPEARAVLAAFVAVGDVERWIAGQPWDAEPHGGWRVQGRLHGWRFRVEPARGGVRVILSGNGEPVAWVVPARP